MNDNSGVKWSFSSCVWVVLMGHLLAATVLATKDIFLNNILSFQMLAFLSMCLSVYITFYKNSVSLIIYNRIRAFGEILQKSDGFWGGIFKSLFCLVLIYFLVELVETQRLAGIIVTWTVFSIIAIGVSYGVINRRRQFVVFLIALAFSIFNWYTMSYTSHYNGIKAALNWGFHPSVAAMKNIVDQDISDIEKLSKLRILYSNYYGEYEIKRNGEDFYFQQSRREEEKYKREVEGSYEIVAQDGNKYRFTHWYANTPEFFLGLIRGITFSVFPDSLTTFLREELPSEYLEKIDEFLFSEQNTYVIKYFGETVNLPVPNIYKADENTIVPKRIKIYGLDNYRYIKGLYFDRSVNLWMSFWILYCAALVIYRFKEIDISNQEALARAKEIEEEKNKKLEEFKLTYGKLMEDFERITTIDARQHLQVWNLNWRSTTEQTICDALHKLKNELQQQSLRGESIDAGTLLKNTPIEIERILFDKVLKPYQDTLMKELKKLPNVLDYRQENLTVKDVVGLAQESIPSTFVTDPINAEAFSVKDDYDKKYDAWYCYVNKDRMISLVHNLLTNSGIALAKHFINQLEKGVFHTGKIQLSYSIKTLSEVNYLSVMVQDNAGGFPADIANKIYREPVPSSDTSSGIRMGGGTSYVKYFADIMGIKINPYNVEEDGEVVGAVVELLIPITEEKKKTE